jgi:P pilus assembly chaperone PapD
LNQKLLPAAFALIAGVIAASAQAQPAPAPGTAPPVTVTTVGANLNISPKRVTFDRNRRSATVYIYNQGTAAATFDINMVDRVMLPDGQIVATDDSGNKPGAAASIARLQSAKTMLQISPRRATLAPGQGQTIRLRVASVPDGTIAPEYRTHLTVTTIPPADVGLTAEQAAQGAPGELRFQINSVFGLSIPAIVRMADPDVRAAIENPHIEYADVSLDGKSPAKRTPVMTFDLVRQGPSSLFGNIEIHALGKKGDPIGVARGVGVYPEIDRRTVHIPLSSVPSAGEKLEITFTDDDTSPGKLLAKTVS